jgi:predicted 2-oxoglutarate/Fe(II)-dependent dioxygenase YbiX
MDGLHVIPNYISIEDLKEIRPLLSKGLNDWRVQIEEAKKKSAYSESKIKSQMINNKVILRLGIPFSNEELYKLTTEALIDSQQLVEGFFPNVVSETKHGVTAMIEGGELPPHIDKMVYTDGLITSNTSPLRDITTVFYLNDDYEGGEIYFPNLGVEIKPEAGSVICFPTSEKYRHGVRTVLSGERFAISQFWTFKSDKT